jgi:hypothetical protein
MLCHDLRLGTTYDCTTRIGLKVFEHSYPGPMVHPRYVIISSPLVYKREEQSNVVGEDLEICKATSRTTRY